VHSITLGQSLAAGVPSNVAIRIRKHWTLAGVFGAHNEAGLQGGFASTADTVVLYANGAYAHLLL